MEKHIPKIVLTGGPCAGKTTALCYLQEKLADLGFHALIVPEAPTLLINSGSTPKDEILSTLHFQQSVLRVMCFLENEFEQNAQNMPNKKSILLCDRGIMDAKPYMPGHIFKEVMEQCGLSVTESRDGRYDAIMHLRTAALGAKEFYTLENNAARMETLEEAQEIDEETLQAWVGSPHLKIIDNSTDFGGKLKRLFQGVCRVLGIPVPLEIERKFQIEPIDLNKLGIPNQAIEIEQSYLLNTNSGEVVRVRKRGQNGVFVYYRTTKKTLRPMVRVETEHRISEAEYEWSLNYRLPNTTDIRKKRFCFTFNNQYFELDILENPQPGLTLLEIELTEENDEVTLPPFVNVIKEVTDDPLFSNRSLAEIT